MNPYRGKYDVPYREPEYTELRAEDLPHHRAARRCPKCGSTANITDYCNPPTTKNCDVVGEHLHLECICHYEWKTQCRNAPGAPE